MYTDRSATNQLILGKWCRTCGRTKPLDAFYRHPTSASGRQSSCNVCHKERAASWQHAHPERHVAHADAWKASHRDDVSRYQRLTRSRRSTADQAFVRLVARVAAATRRAIQDGRLTRPDACSQCARTGAVLDAVHEDYLEPLRVVWLCRRCHLRWNVARRRSRVEDR